MEAGIQGAFAQSLTTTALKSKVAYDGHQPGDPNKAARILTELIHGDGPFAEVALEELPTTLTLGADAYEVIKNRLAEDAKDLERWEGVSKSCDIETSQ